MLADVSLWLTDVGYNVSVIGRSVKKHLNLVNNAKEPRLINSLPVDYTNYQLLKEQVRNAIEKDGPISLVVSWTQSVQSLKIINKIVSEQESNWKLYQVKGSRRYFEDDILTIHSNCEPRSIYLIRGEKTPSSRNESGIAH